MENLAAPNLEGHIVTTRAFLLSVARRVPDTFRVSTILTDTDGGFSATLSDENENEEHLLVNAGEPWASIDRKIALAVCALAGK